MARLFISPASANNAATKALGQWLSEQGFDDVFLDIDPDRGRARRTLAGALKSAARTKAIRGPLFGLFLAAVDTGDSKEAAALSGGCTKAWRLFT